MDLIKAKILLSYIMEKDHNQKKSIYKCAIVGAGPAGLSAAIYLKRANIPFVIFDKTSPCSKLMKISNLDNLIGFEESPVNLALNMFKHARKMGIEVLSKNIVSIDPQKNGYILKTDSNENYYSFSIILASGISEKTPPIQNLKKFIGKGVSTCVTCDGYFYKNKKVILFNVDEKTQDEIKYLSGICDKVYVITKSRYIHGKTWGNNVQILSEKNITQVDGKEKIEKVITDKNEYDVSALFISNATEIGNSYYTNLKIKNGHSGITMNKEMETSKKGVFVCGDLCDRKIKQISVAIGDGAVAATSAISYIKNNEK